MPSTTWPMSGLLCMGPWMAAWAAAQRACSAVPGFLLKYYFRAYIGIMEKKMETIIMKLYNLGSC